MLVTVSTCLVLTEQERYVFFIYSFFYFHNNFSSKNGHFYNIDSFNEPTNFNVHVDKLDIDVIIN